MIRLKKIGNLPVRKSTEIPFSRVGIGFEKLDRAVFDPEKAYDLVGDLGVKYARIQAGWMRTEKEKGVYDFAWIDSIVDNLLARGVEPWINLVYGNPLYTEVAKNYFGAVGCPPVAPEELKGWCAYVRALVSHMKGRVSKYEIWNEPDLRYSWRVEGHIDGTAGVPSGDEYGDFAIATAHAIREADKSAYIIGFSLGDPGHFGFVTAAMKKGLGDVIDAVSYHVYATDTIRRVRRYEDLKALVHSFNPKLDIIQGESGTQSEYGFAGALNQMNWTREKQTKHLLRLMVTDLGIGCDMVTYFSTMDMIEALNGYISDKKSYLDYGYFGVVSADFDENGIATGEYSRKPSYFALQTLASLFAGDFKIKHLPFSMFDRASLYVNGTDYNGPEMMHYSFVLADGSKLITYWRNTDILTSTYTGTITVELATDKVPELIDLRDGSIYAFPENMVENLAGVTHLHNIPLLDYPLALRY